MNYFRPTQLSDALAWLEDNNAGIVAGCTDLFAATNSQYLQKKSFEQLLDITAIPELCKIELGKETIRIGATVKWREIIESKLPPSFDALKASAREIGSLQIQNSGTLGGNLCNASPAADGVPPLLVLDAKVELASLRGSRQMDLHEFLQGPRQTVIRPDEILSAIIIPTKSAAGISSFLKLGARKYLVISIAMIATRILIKNNRISNISIAVGSCSAVATRLLSVEKALRGASTDIDLFTIISRSLVSKDLMPIDDIRADKHYRTIAARELVIRAITALIEDAETNK